MVYWSAFPPPLYDYYESVDLCNTLYNDVEFFLYDYNLSVVEVDKDGEYNVGDIFINDKQKIRIDYTNDTHYKGRANSVFSISYTVTEISKDNYFDVELFTELVNLNSKKKIKVDFVNEFLISTEDKYSSTKYGFSGEDFEISKQHSFDFFENWIIGYQQTEDKYAELWFYGCI